MFEMHANDVHMIPEGALKVLPIHERTGSCFAAPHLECALVVVELLSATDHAVLDFPPGTAAADQLSYLMTSRGV